MSKITLTGFALLPVLFFANASGNNESQSKQTASEALSGTLQKMIVENASVTMQLDLNGLNGSNSLVARPILLHFAAAPNSFLPILVFNDLLRGLQPGSMALALQNSSPAGANAPGYNHLPGALSSSLKRLAVEKLPSGRGFDLAVRDSNTGFTFFNIEGHQYNYDAAAQSFTITGGRLLMSKRWVFRQRLAHWPEQFPSARRCNRSKSTTLLGVKRSQWSCHPCNMQSVPECRILCPVRMLSLEMLRTWHNLILPSEPRLGWL